MISLPANERPLFQTPFFTFGLTNPRKRDVDESPEFTVDVAFEDPRHVARGPCGRRVVLSEWAGSDRDYWSRERTSEADALKVGDSGYRANVDTCSFGIDLQGAALVAVVVEVEAMAARVCPAQLRAGGADARHLLPLQAVAPLPLQFVPRHLLELQSPHAAATCTRTGTHLQLPSIVISSLAYQLNPE